MSRVLRAVLLGFCLLAPALAAAETLDPAETRGLAVRLIAGGRPEAALPVTAALLRRDPGDSSALAIRARALRDLGRGDEARAVAAAAWRAAESDGERYRAALVRAQALASDGARMRAQVWLRRAAELAPSERQRQRAIRDFRYVRRRNPLRVALSFDIAPTDNVNNGSNQSEATLFGLPFLLSGASQALSGTRVAAGVRLGYRLAQSRRQQTEAGFTAYHQSYLLSDEAKVQAPGVAGSDFAYTVLSASLTRRYSPGSGEGLYEGTATLGANWYGGEPLSTFLRLEGERTARVGARNLGTLGVELELQERTDGSGDEAVRLGLSGEIERKLEGGGRLGLGGRLARSGSDAAALDYSLASASVDWTPDLELMGGDVTFSGEIELRAFERSPFRLGGRTDLSRSLGVELQLDDLGRYGYAPVVRLERSWRASDVDLYDSDSFTVRVGLRSSF